jgi:hypothetical protein
VRLLVDELEDGLVGLALAEAVGGVGLAGGRAAAVVVEVLGGSGGLGEVFVETLEGSMLS